MELVDYIRIENFDAKNIKIGKTNLLVLIESSSDNAAKWIFETYERWFMMQQEAKIASAGVGMLELQKNVYSLSNCKDGCEARGNET